nr:hypothetical protein [Mucilaginibacter sp. E4BP6]
MSSNFMIQRRCVHCKKNDSYSNEIIFFNDIYLIKGLREPLIAESLFYDV